MNRKTPLLPLLFLCGALCWNTRVIAQDDPSDPNAGIKVDKYPGISGKGPTIDYPLSDLIAGREGMVFVKVLVGIDGKVHDTRVMHKDSSVSEQMVQASLEAAKQQTFTPAESKGKPVTFWATMPFNFKIAGTPKEYNTDEREVIERYMLAYNTQNAKALSNVFHSSANYVGQYPPKERRPLLAHHQESWQNPAILGAKMTWGKLEGKDVVVVWTRIMRTDNKLGNWQKGTYLTPDVRDSKIALVYGTVVLTDPEASAKIIAEPPK